jgi:hypothetical protein
MNSRIEQLAVEIVSRGLAAPPDLHGCEPDEIEALQRKFAITLPETYCDWLRIMGRGAGQYLKGSDAFYPTLLELRDFAEELLVEDGKPFSLPQDAFVFLMHQGYTFLYFLTVPHNPDPPVVHYAEGKSPTERWACLSDYFQQVLDDHVKALQRL